MRIDRARLAGLVERETDTYTRARPVAQAAHASASSLLGGVPMTWMNKWAGGFPVQLARARGNRVVDTDGHEYVDFALGDTGAMAGHSPEPLARALTEVLTERGGITAMLPTADAAWVGEELTRRFRVSRWSFTLTATDANRWALRLARLVTGRPRVLVFSYCYHGSVDETIVVVGPDGLLNRGVLLTPFHNMALMCPATTEVDVDLHVGLVAEAAVELRATSPGR